MRATYLVQRPDRTYTFTVFAGYACLKVWNGPEVLCQGGHLGVGSALLAVPDLKTVADKWLAQYEDRLNSNMQKRRKK